MPPRCSHPSSTDQTVIDFDAPAPEPLTPILQTVAESQPAYSFASAWIDTAGRTRTWSLKYPHGTQLAEITTKSAARKLAYVHRRVMDHDTPCDNSLHCFTWQSHTYHVKH